MNRKLTKSELTKAIQTYAHKHNHYARTVRTMTVLFNAAIKEYKSCH